MITMAILLIKKQDRIGTDPFHTNGNILIDICSGAFGASELHLADFENPSNRDAVGTILSNAVSGWYWSTLEGTAFPFINPTGSTQFRLRFQIQDNDDGGNDYLKFYSGNARVEDRPQLRIEYYVPR